MPMCHSICRHTTDSTHKLFNIIYCYICNVRPNVVFVANVGKNNKHMIDMILLGLSGIYKNQFYDIWNVFLLQVWKVKKALKIQVLWKGGKPTFLVGVCGCVCVYYNWLIFCLFS